ncbi:MAG: tyrosine-type recombinase/integrase [Planctomycetes bacterium]|nr:tyrosine-type recombinase/integrase [Planctomycetota bacterium]
MIKAGKNPTIKSKKIGPHTFRHSTAIHLIRSGNDINVVCDWLGHASINTTHMYLEIDIYPLRSGFRNFGAGVCLKF